MPITLLSNDGESMIDDQALVSEVLENVQPWPKDVLDVDFSLGEDHDGDPIVRIYVHVAKDVSPSNEKVHNIRAFSDLIRDRLLDKNIQRWPHVRLLEA